MATVLKTTSAVIEALGGVGEVADMCGVGYTAAHNWKQQGFFPRSTFVVLRRKLAETPPGYEAPLSLWRMRETLDERQAS